MTLGLIAAAVIAAATGPSGTGVAEPQGFHGEPYRSAVPATLTGATTVDADGAAAAAGRGAILIDVLPRTGRPAGLPAGTLWRDPPHPTIPGAVWLPGVGYDALGPADEARFAAALAELTHGDRAAPILFFCKADCWMSWNAARRALLSGYTAVTWFPQGTDGWAASGRPLEEAARIMP